MADSESYTAGEKDGLPKGDKASLFFNFDGRATVKGNRRLQRYFSLNIVKDFNGELPAIIDEIKTELRAKLPDGAKIEAGIEFSRGSIEWEGVIAIVTATATTTALIADNIAFIEYAAKAVKYSINKIIRNRIEPRAPVKAIQTNVGVRGQQLQRFHPASRFLWWCAGAVPEIIQDSRTEHSKYEGIGGAVLTTGVLALFSGFYATYTVFDESPYKAYVGLVLGVIWGLVIFNLDRYIVSSMKKEIHGPVRSFLKELAPAVPRLLLTIIIGITVSKPLELRLMKGQIEKQIEIGSDIDIRRKEASLRKNFEPQQAIVSRDIDEIEKEIQAMTARANQLENEFHGEMDSTAGSGKYGYSIVAQQKEKSLQDAKKEIESLRMIKMRLQSQRNNLEAQLQTQLAHFAEEIPKDFFARITALSDLAKIHDSVRWSNYFIVLLLILVEATPVLVKLSSPIGPYDIKLNVRNDVESRAANDKGRAMKEILDHHYLLVSESERHADDLFSPMRNTLRAEQLRQMVNQWRAQFANGQGPTFEEIEDFIRDKVFTNRRV